METVDVVEMVDEGETVLVELTQTEEVEVEVIEGDRVEVDDGERLGEEVELTLRVVEREDVFEPVPVGDVLLVMEGLEEWVEEEERHCVAVEDVEAVGEALRVPETVLERETEVVTERVSVGGAVLDGVTEEVPQEETV